jgi:diacylglycerol kinase
MRGLWDRYGDRLRHWLAVIITIVVVLTYMEVRDTEADWTVFLLAIGLLLVLEFLFSGSWFRRRPGPPDRRG